MKLYKADVIKNIYKEAHNALRWDYCIMQGHTGSDLLICGGFEKSRLRKKKKKLDKVGCSVLLALGGSLLATASLLGQKNGLDVG